jgi:hypothetical protein
MKRILLRGLEPAICLALVLSMILPAAVMADALPCNFVGTARIDGEPVADGIPIIAYALKMATAEMDEVGSTLTVSDPAAGFYELVVELDTATHLPEIYFKIGNLWANETATWMQYGLVAINLTATTGASTTPQPPTTPSSPSPADDATSVTIPVTLSVLVSDPNGDTMTVTFYDASDDSVIATASGVASGSRASVSWTGLESGTQYNWYATACDDGALCTTSATWSFTTKTAAGEPTPPTPPSSPSPADDATNITIPVTLSVLVSDPNGDTMTVTFYDASDDSVIGTANGVASGSRASVSWAGLELGTQYNWYATACDDGALCTTSATWSFTTKTAVSEPTPPTAPSSPSPADDATNITIPVTLSVLVSDPNGDAMTVTFYDASDDSVIGTAVDVASGSQVSVSWTGLELGTQYSWYATACDAGALCTTSATWSFTTTLESRPSCGVSVGLPWYIGGGILLALVVVAIVLAKRKRQSSEPHNAT